MKQKGVWLAVGAYSIWGIFPLYWKLLQQVPAMQLLSHRIVWSFATMLVFIIAAGQLKQFGKASLSWRILGIYLIASLFIAVNWLTYVWAVNSGHIVETSLGYFINPLLSVLIGVVFLKERLRIGQWMPLILTACGVLYLTLAHGQLPWIALTLAFSFAFYGLIKKIAPLSALYGLLLETALMLLPAMALLYISNQAGTGAFMHSPFLTNCLLVGAGIVTTIPLLMFASAAQRIPLSLVGILQYIAPTFQFLIGIIVYGEPFSKTQIISYSLVWIALIIFAVEGYLNFKRKTEARGQATE